MNREPEDLISPQEFYRRMRDAEDYGPEVSHIDADKLLCEVLRGLGYGLGVEVFEKMCKWYA